MIQTDNAANVLLEKKEREMVYYFFCSLYGCYRR